MVYGKIRFIIGRKLARYVSRKFSIFVCKKKKNKNTCHGFQQLCKSPIKLFGTVDQNEKLVTWINVSFSFFSSLDTIFLKKIHTLYNPLCFGMILQNYHFIQVPTVDRIFVCWGPKLCKRTTSLVKGYNVMRLANKFRLVGNTMPKGRIQIYF